jgi:hypothetical protein
LTIAFYMVWICIVLIVHSYLHCLIPAVGHLRRVKLFRANCIGAPMGDRWPEPPEFVKHLIKEIPYYHLRQTIRPRFTVWPHVRYKYKSSFEDAKEKIRYDPFYIKKMSAGLDLPIFFNTIKLILLARGTR